MGSQMNQNAIIIIWGIMGVRITWGSGAGAAWGMGVAMGSMVDGAA